MKDLVKQLINLLKVRTLLSLMYGITTCVLTLQGKVSPEMFISLTTMIFVFYFKKDDDKEKIEK